MKIVFTHTDFRIYWPARLEALHKFLGNKSIELLVVEIAGKGSPYGFAVESSSKPAYWHYLFPELTMEEIPAYVANKALLKKLDDLQPDIIFCGAIAFPSGVAGVKWAIRNKRKCVVFDNARLQDVPRRWYVNLIKKRVYSACDAIFCPAPSWEETFKYFGFKVEQIFYGVNAVDNKFWYQNNYDETKHEQNLSSEYFIAVGRQIAVKNFKSLLKAYQIYNSMVNNSHNLVFIGDGPERKSLEHFVTNNNLKNVSFETFKSQEELKFWYGNAICLILPSYKDTWGNVVNEAMASGLPVLVSDQAGCASTLVKEGVNGFTFSPYDVNSLAKLMTKITTMSKEERAMMGRKSLEIISEWGIERFCSGAYEAIKYVSGKRKRVPGMIGRIIINLWQGRYRPV